MPREKMEQILLANALTTETATAVMLFNKNTKAIVRWPDGNTDILDIVTGVLQRYTLAPFAFIIYLNYVERTSIDLIRENGLTIKKIQTTDDILL